jgi:molecular chaperone GrpE
MKKDPKKTDEPAGHREEGNASEENREKTVTLSKADYEALLARVKELEGAKEQLLRSAADFDNAKKRLTREREEFLKFGQENLIRNILPILDNFHRALDHATEEGQQKSLAGLVTGIQMIFKQLQDTLQNQGLKKLEGLNQKFDPHMHEAVGYVHDGGQEDTVAEELEAGYQLHDRLLRPAKVRVRMAQPPSVQSSEKECGDKPETIT